MPKILIIEDDTAFSQMLQKFLAKHLFDVTPSYNLKEAKAALDQDNFDLILSDVRLPEGDGVSFLSEIKEKHPQTQVILMTHFAEVKTAVKAMKRGAFDYIAKPFTPERMLEVITNALASDKVRDNIPVSLKRNNGNPLKRDASHLTGTSEASLRLQQYISLVAPTNMSVLLIGESGTGKEVTARSIHKSSSRKGNNFIAVDCGAIPKELTSSEFFGHVKGSFTGAIEDKVGFFEAANGGTLFLDEIGNLSYESQIQLLRAIQERKIKRVGSTGEIDVDVRILAATNEDLIEAVGQGNFREDLFHRLNEFTIELPSLKDRGEDLVLFANFFLEIANTELGKTVKGFSELVKQRMLQYHWPGNLRELKNVVKRGVLFTKGELIQENALPSTLHASNHSDEDQEFSKQKFEKELILRALKQTNFNKSEAAKLLKMTRKTLYNKIKRYQLKV
ncbi:sigma-54-dependent transcriptional regulator [Flagellimonas algicola]|uniref:Sigma-54-dependent Fis family transcriptional regulator n=1 Tax=Flagellimonas algicola TaxID=2583815 RepID=A0ABY2WLL9_9FLAO|nr:sigma-54 dependent transcriptional regulator [Allomuricauda algicola]TMU55402.1 sigma-54-dependent Fis family transcriptional regulator [Allomuricauda algicola]